MLVRRGVVYAIKRRVTDHSRSVSNDGEDVYLGVLRLVGWCRWCVMKTQKHDLSIQLVVTWISQERSHGAARCADTSFKVDQMSLDQCAWSSP